MRFPTFAYPRAAMQAQVLARLESGMTLATVASLPGYPSRQTIHRWAKADPIFAQNLAYARAWAAGERRGWAIAAEGYDAARAEAFLLAVRRGAAVRDLVKMPEWPNRDRLDAWKRERPEFAPALAKAARFAREERDRAWAKFDQDVADRVVLRVSKGETVPQVARDPTMPGETALRRWRRRRPEFDTVLKMAKLAGHRRRMAKRCACTPELTEAIAHHIIHGGSLRSAAQTVPGAPHHVTLYGWARRRPDFAAEMAAAARFRDTMLLDRILESDARDGPLRQRLGQLSGGAKRRAG
jgi:hypothetical protein